MSHHPYKNKKERTKETNKQRKKERKKLRKEEGNPSKVIQVAN